MASGFERYEKMGQVARKCRHCSEMMICPLPPVNHLCQIPRIPTRTPIPGVSPSPSVNQDIPHLESATPRSRFPGVGPP